MPPRFAVADVRTNPELLRVLLQHAYRGIRVQFLLRLILLAFMVVSIIAVPPARDRGSSALILAGYTAWTIGLGLWSRRGGEAPVRWMWLALLIDAAALSALTLVAGVASSHTWTADLLVNGFFILPMLAATQLRPAVCAAVAGPATAAYFAVSWATKAANTEPWSSILLRTSVLAGLGVGCIALSRVQLSRVLTIAGLARQRSELLNELLTVQARERAALAEQLHDGALQYVLAARHDLEDVRADGDPEALARIEFALTESSVLLRDIVSQLHPAVLQSAGLPRALSDLVASIAARAHLTWDVDTAVWPATASTVDDLLYGCARELLTNVVKHAHASTVRLELTMMQGRATLRVIDDGVGMGGDAPALGAAQGHIGLASMGTRVAAAGGELSIESEKRGTVVTLQVPVAQSSAINSSAAR